LLAGPAPGALALYVAAAEVTFGNAGRPVGLPSRDPLPPPGVRHASATSTRRCPSPASSGRCPEGAPGIRRQSLGYRGNHDMSPSPAWHRESDNHEKSNFFILKLSALAGSPPGCSTRSSSRMIPRSARSALIASARAKSRDLRALRRSWIAVSMASVSSAPPGTRPRVPGSISPSTGPTRAGWPLHSRRRERGISQRVHRRQRERVFRSSHSASITLSGTVPPQHPGSVPARDRTDRVPSSPH